MILVLRSILWTTKSQNKKEVSGSNNQSSKLLREVSKEILNTRKEDKSEDFRAK